MNADNHILENVVLIGGVAVVVLAFTLPQAAVLALFIWMPFYFAREKKKDAEKWFGHMECLSCGYVWTSRRNTPPRQCANCRGRHIQIIKGR